MKAVAIAALAALLSLPLAACATAIPANPSLADAAEISFTPLRLSAGPEDIDHVGRLIYRGGLILSASDPRFGGWSGLIVSADGTRMLSQSDEAHWLRAALRYDRAGNLSGIGDAQIADMRDLNGGTMAKMRGDAEGLTALSPLGPDGPVLVSFEEQARVWRYDVTRSLDVLPQPVAMPDMSAEDNNQGLEGLTMFDAHTILAVAEDHHGDSPDMDAWLVCYPKADSCARPDMLHVIPHPPFAISDAAMSPDGRHLYLLERHYYGLLGGIAIAVREIDASDVRPGARLEGHEIARFDMSENIDNMEGLSLRRGADGKTYLYMISDDNYNHLMQRTLLMMFELSPPPSVHG